YYVSTASVISSLALHDALPIWPVAGARGLPLAVQLREDLRGGQPALIGGNRPVVRPLGHDADQLVSSGSAERGAAEHAEGHVGAKDAGECQQLRLAGRHSLARGGIWQWLAAEVELHGGDEGGGGVRGATGHPAGHGHILVDVDAHRRRAGRRGRGWVLQQAGALAPQVADDL